MGKKALHLEGNTSWHPSSALSTRFILLSEHIDLEDNSQMDHKNDTSGDIYIFLFSFFSFCFYFFMGLRMGLERGKSRKSKNVSETLQTR